jgi:RNA-splicing ligase RtcB
MRAAMNCAMANRHVIAHLVRETFAEIFPTADGIGAQGCSFEASRLHQG